MLICLQDLFTFIYRASAAENLFSNVRGFLVHEVKNIGVLGEDLIKLLPNALYHNSLFLFILLLLHVYCFQISFFLRVLIECLFLVYFLSWKITAVIYFFCVEIFSCSWEMAKAPPHKYRVPKKKRW